MSMGLRSHFGSSRVVCLHRSPRLMSLVGGFGGFGNFGTPVAQPAFGGFGTPVAQPAMSMGLGSFTAAPMMTQPMAAPTTFAAPIAAPTTYAAPHDCGADDL